MPCLKSGTARDDGPPRRRYPARRTLGMRCLLLALLFIVELCQVIDASPASAAVAASGRSSRTPLSRCPAGSVRSSPAADSAPCRHFLNARFGTLTTPNFPAAFPVPFVCSWIINATGFEPESFITLYLTQMYLTRGVQAVQYSFRNETHAIGRKELDELHTLRPRPYSVYRIKARYLEVLVNLDELVNANLRVEHRLVDVYGFNITYEIQPNSSRIRSETCNAVNCTFNGHCYANGNYSQFQCSCLPGFSGKYCQYGPDCNPDLGINICKNGGKCSYRTGLTVVRCSCPLNYNGSLCEFRRESIPAKECVARFGLNCSHQCSLTDAGSAECRCPLDYALKSDNLTCYSLVPYRALGYAEFDRPSSWNDSESLQGFTEFLRKMVDDYTAVRLTLGSVQLISPGSGRLQFLLWNSEKYNISWTTPVASQMRYRNTRDVRSALMIPPVHTPTQWNSSVATFYSQMDRLRKRREQFAIHGEQVSLKSVTVVVVPALHIEWVRVDVKGGRVREGHPFIVACNANGTEKVKLRWFKDGYPVDPSYALLRNVSLFVHQERNLRGFYTLYLEVKQAVLADRGHYECQASDWGQTLRQGVFLDVITPPILDLMPNNPSVLPNTPVNLTCRDENHLARRTMTKYVWLRNGHPIESSCREIIEGLTPVGSLLKIASIQEGANYTCRAENGTTLAEVTTHITVVRPEEVCPQQLTMNVNWPMTAVGSVAYRFCPNGYVGVAKRRCSSAAATFADPGIIGVPSKLTWQWDLPVFSHCSERFVADLHRKLKLVSLGYKVSEIGDIVTNFTSYVWEKLNRTTNSTISADSVVFLPGEGNTMLDLARSLESFLWKGSHLMEPVFWNTTAVNYFYALDALLSMPTSFFYPDNVTPVLRLIQSHTALLGLNPRVENSRSGNPLDSIRSNQLKNSVIDIHVNKRELKYKGSWPAFQSEAQFRTVQQLAPAQFVYLTNGTNFTSDISVKEKVIPAKDGTYLCALLRLQPTNHSRNWDVDSCSVKQLSNSSSFECQCPQAGTVLLLYVTKVPREEPEASPDLWVLIWFAAAISLLVLTACVGGLCIRWYNRRTSWRWFKVQLGIALFPISMSYFLPLRVIIPDVYWAFVLTTCLYVYLTTILAISAQGKMDLTRPNEEDMEYNNHRNQRLIGLTCGVPIILGSIHCLLSELVFRLNFTTWLAELGSISGILFCLLYIILLIMNVAMYFAFRDNKGRLEKVQTTDFESSAYDNKEVHRDRGSACLWMACLSVPFLGSLLLQHNWESIAAHCCATAIHTITTCIWSFIIMTFDGDESVFCFQSRVRLVETHTVSEMLNATALVESPQRRNTSQNRKAGSSNGSKHRRLCGSVITSLNDIRTQRSRRTCRHQQASSPLLRRAGLGPEVLRAFGLDHTEKLLSTGETRTSHNVTSPNAPSTERKRAHSDSSDEMQHDDLDSGFGLSGGGESQKFISVDKISEVFKVFRRFGWKFTIFGRSLAWSSNGDSFRSRKSTMSSATTTELPAEQGSLSGIEEVEANDLSHFPQGPSAPSFSARRARTRWKEDYGRENELSSSETSEISITCKPFRGQCFIRCSPEKTGKRATKDCPQSVDGVKNCERCWQNPETPPCERCSPQPTTSGTIYMQAIIEIPPRCLENSCEYLDMDPAGSLAIDSHGIKRIQVYYNLRSLRSSPQHAIHPSVKSSGCRTYSSTPSLSSHRDKKIISGRIVKKYRNSSAIRAQRNTGPNQIHPKKL